MLTNKKRNISILMIILMLISLFTPSSLKAAGNNFIIKKYVSDHLPIFSEYSITKDLD